MSSTVYGSPGRSGAYRPRRTGPRWGRILLVLISLVALVLLLFGGCGAVYATQLNGKLHRTDAFAGIEGERPAQGAGDAMNILVLGSDSRDGSVYDPKDRSSNTKSVGGERADTIMVLHLPSEGDRAYLIGIPRDTWVTVPAHDGKGRRQAKINAAFAWGGIPLAVATVEQFTGVRIDHVVKVDFVGFKKMTDAVGGVDVMVDRTVTDPRSKRTFTAGMNHLEGEAALDYVRQRYALPRGDFDRILRQQIFLRALLSKVSDSGTLSNPTRLKAFLDAAAESMTVDDDFSLTRTAVRFRSIRSDDLTFLISPNLGSRNIDGQSAVVSDKPKAASLWAAVHDDAVAEWVQDNPVKMPTGGR